MSHSLRKKLETFVVFAKAYLAKVKMAIQDAIPDAGT